MGKYWKIIWPSGHTGREHQEKDKATGTLKRTKQVKKIFLYISPTVKT